MAAGAYAVRTSAKAAGAFVCRAGVQALVANKWTARKCAACRQGGADPSEIRTSVPIRRAARRNAEALLSRSKKQESTLKLEQEREHDAMLEKTARLRALRLAKEAADREAAAVAAATPRPKSRRAGQK